MRFGAFAHVEAKNFHARPVAHARFLTEMRDEAHRSREQFVAHFRATYDEFPDLPIWAVAETMTFGSMFTLFKISTNRIQKNVGHRYAVSGTVLFSWLQTLNYVRNLCAHHARLWNRELAIRPVIPDLKNAPEWYEPTPITNNRLFGVLMVLRYMLCHIAPQSGWRGRLYALFDEFPDVPLAAMGLDTEWRQHRLWR